MSAELHLSGPANLPVLDLSLADDPLQRPSILKQLHSALYDIGFLYIINHGVSANVIDSLTQSLPALFDLPEKAKAKLSKLNSPHFLGYSGFAEETTLGKEDLREQFDFATELPVVWREGGTFAAKEDSDRDFSKLYWRLRGPNQWPAEEDVPGFRKAFKDYMNAVSELSYRFVHLIEEAFIIPVGTFDLFFRSANNSAADDAVIHAIPPQNRIKLIKYPPSQSAARGQGVGAHKDSSGWLTFLCQVGEEEGLEVLSADGEWISAPPIPGTFVVNFGNAFEAATEGAVRATIHRVKHLEAPSSTSKPRFSIPFFQGLLLDMTVTEIRSYIPGAVRSLRSQQRDAEQTQVDPGKKVDRFLDPRWDNLGESQLRKWIRSHQDVGQRWYGDEVTNFYLR